MQTLPLNMNESQKSPSKCEPLSNVLYLRNSLVYFFYHAFWKAILRVEGDFVACNHPVEWLARLQYLPRTATISARLHIKTTIALCKLAWELYRMGNKWNEWGYMGFTEEASGAQLRRLKRYIEALPEIFSGYQNLTTAETILYYKHGGQFFYCEPMGIMSANRGKHPKGLICDDILKDPTKKLDIGTIMKISTTFFDVVESIPTRELHVIGTRQDECDLFGDLKGKAGYDVREYKSFDEETLVPLWKEKYPYEELMRIKNRMGAKSFAKEFQCKPVRGEEAFITANQYAECERKRLKNYQVTARVRIKGTRNAIVGGFDIGKKTHPSHLAIFAEHNKKLIQIHSKFMDGWNYTEQIEYIRQAIKCFGVFNLFYDDTRSEFEEARERGHLPPEMKGLSFTSNNKYTMATEFERVVTNKEIQFLVDERQKRHILSIDSDLKAPETSDGHGDAFFSVCLALKAWRENATVMIWSPS